MIKRPKDLKYVGTEVIFNYRSFCYLEVDLHHVNRNGRSKLSLNEVATIFKMIVNGKSFEASAKKQFESEMCSYYVIKGEYERKKYKTVFCICSDRPNSIGVITLFRLGE